MRTSGTNRWTTLLLAVAVLAGVAPTAAAQSASSERGTRNVTLVSHLALEGGSGDVAIEQEMARPFAYLSRRSNPAGFSVIDVADPAQADVLVTWEIEAASAHRGPGATDVAYFKLGDRYYLVQAFQFEAGGPDADLGAIVFDVTGLPDPAAVREAARIQGPAAEGGFHHLFAYKHSDGRVLLFATGGGAAHVYDAQKLLAGEAGHVAALDTPEQLQPGSSGYHDVFVGYHPDTEQDRFYGAGAGGYYVYDVSDLANPVLLTAVNSAAVQRGHAVTPTPDGRYLVAAAGYRASPLRIFDLQPALDGEIDRVRTAVGAWTADWRNFSEQHEVRWPYVFVAALDDGFQVFNLRDPERPYTVGYYRTPDGPPGRLTDATKYHGAWSIDVRNADGLIVVSDLGTGFWTFRLDGFEGWDGRGWGFPNVSSAQDWDHGPDGR